MEMLSQAGAVMAVLLLLGMAVWALGKRGPLGLRRGAHGAGRDLEVLERTALSHQHTLHLVRCGEQRMLLVTWQGGALNAGPAPFAETFRGILSGGGGAA